MKIVKLLLIVLSLISMSVAKHHFSQEEQTNHCAVCQKVVYQLKFDKIADCGSKPCKNTVNPI